MPSRQSFSPKSCCLDTISSDEGLPLSPSFNNHPHDGYEVPIFPLPVAPRHEVVASPDDNDDPSCITPVAADHNDQQDEDDDNLHHTSPPPTYSQVFTTAQLHYAPTVSEPAGNQHPQDDDFRLITCTATDEEENATDARVDDEDVGCGNDKEEDGRNGDADLSGHNDVADDDSEDTGGFQRFPHFFQKSLLIPQTIPSVHPSHHHIPVSHLRLTPSDYILWVMMMIIQPMSVKRDERPLRLTRTQKGMTISRCD